VGLNERNTIFNFLKQKAVDKELYFVIENQYNKINFEK